MGHLGVCVVASVNIANANAETSDCCVSASISAKRLLQDTR